MVQILDCTLRDGGYRNNWHFTYKEVQDYLREVKNYNVDTVEIGFRDFDNGEGFGICAYCPDKFINSLDISEDLQVAAMLKAEQIEDAGVLHELFDLRRNTRIDLVRVAAPCHKTANYGRILQILKDKGYKTALNLTKVRPDSVIKVESRDLIDILYIADTFGKLCPDDVIRLFDVVKEQYDGVLGFHGHNDRGLALKNSLAAIKHGVTYIDSTINGVGKGAGNVSTGTVMQRNLFA